MITLTLALVGDHVSQFSNTVTSLVVLEAVTQE